MATERRMSVGIYVFEMFILVFWSGEMRSQTFFGELTANVTVTSRQSRSMSCQ